jgi:hypothetical protein
MPSTDLSRMTPQQSMHDRMNDRPERRPLRHLSSYEAPHLTLKSHVSQKLLHESPLSSDQIDSVAIIHQLDQAIAERSCLL